MNKRTSSKTLTLDNTQSSINHLSAVITPLVKVMKDKKDSVEYNGPTEGPEGIDRNLAYIISITLFNLHRQYHGTPTNAKGQVFQNIKQHLDTQQAKCLRLIEDAKGDPSVTSDPDFIKASSWFEINEVKASVYPQLITIFEALYQEVAGTKYEFKETAPVRIHRAMKITADKTAAATNVFETLQARKVTKAA
jgi:hypothetical protein